MLSVFCCANLKTHTCQYNTVINFHNKTVGIFSISLINIVNILRRIIERLFK